VPSAEGKIRTKVRIAPGTAAPAIVLRAGQTDWRLEVNLVSTGKAVEFRVTKGTAGSTVPPKTQVTDERATAFEGIKDQAVIEVSLSGSSLLAVLTGSGNARAGVHHADEQLARVSEWGIDAKDAWFESVEVQPFEVAASAPEQRWHDWIAETRGAASFVNHPKIRDDQGLLHITAPSAEFYGPIFRNGRVRILCKTPDNEDEVPVFLRYKVEANNVTRYQATVSKRSGVKIGLFESSGGDMKWTDLQTWPLARDFDWTREYLLEFAAIDDVLTVSVNGQEIGSIRDPKLTNSGECGFNARKGTQIRKFEYLPLDSQGLRMKSKTDSSDS
jgi:hypothetical protein